jgi:hypothetical protein
MQLKAAKIITRRRIWRSAKEGREGPDVPDVGLLHFLAVRRAVMSSVIRCRRGLMDFSGIESSCLTWG